MRNRKISREVISQKFLEEVQKALKNNQDLTIQRSNLTFDNLNRDVLPLIQIQRLKSKPFHRVNERQKWAFLYSVQIIFKKENDDNPYEQIDLIIDDLAEHFNKTALESVDLNGLVESIVIVDIDDDEGIFNNKAVVEVLFEIIAV